MKSWKGIWKEERNWIFVTIMLGIFILFLCFPDLLIRMEKRNIMQIRVVLEEPIGEDITELQRGMYEAAKENQVELYFDRNISAAKEEATKKKEWYQETDGLIIGMENPKEQREAYQKFHKKMPMVSIWSQKKSRRFVASFATNQKKQGEILGAQLNQAATRKQRILLLKTKQYSPIVQQRLDGIGRRLQQTSRDYHLLCIPYGERGEHLLKEACKRMPIDIIVAPNPKLQQIASKALQKMHQTHIKIYGIGVNQSILDKIEEGRIACVVAQNMFAMGYLSVQTLVQALQGKKNVQIEKDFPSFIINKKNLYSRENQKQFFPIS